MRSRLSSKILVLMFIGMFTIAPTALAANHSLAWGVEAGEEFTYALQRKILDLNFVLLMPYWLGFVLELEEGDLFNATIMELDLIPEDIGVGENLPVSHATLAIGSETLEIDSTAFVIPIDDWAFQTERLNLTIYPDTTLIDTDDEWGTTEESTFTVDSSTYSYIFEWRYDKTDGTLTYVRFMLSSFGSSHVDIVIAQWEEGMPTVLPADLQLSTILIIVIVGAVGVIVAILVYKWIKMPKGLAAELGK
ncbi:MAG: hypothetical protein KAQ65_08260 [Candidatus Thorarchaeota archaeon]|nr:hypothetical protein [Candidatus Thorarchaeota archaeon]